MGNLKRLIKSSYEPLISIDRNGGRFAILDFEDISFNHHNMFSSLPESVIDKTTLGLIQVADLHKAVNHAKTVIGSSTLFRSLMQPPTSLQLISAKQESLRELENNDKLRNSIEDYLGEIKNGELDLFKFIYGEMGDSFSSYRIFKDAMKAGKNISNATRNIPLPESKYLSILVEDIKNFGESGLYRLMRGPIYKTSKGLKSKEDIKFYTPRLKFIPRQFTLFNSSPHLALGGLITGVQTGLIENGEHLIAPTMGIIPLSLMSFLYSNYLKPMFDYNRFIKPLRKKTIGDYDFNLAIDSVGKLDELLSFTEFRKAMPHDTVIPKITDEESHYFMAKNLRNPIQAKSNKKYVPNEVNLNGSRLTFITGPNSGGKTTYCKSIIQNQILGQIGGYVVASDANINIADRIAYQAPMFDSLQDEEGRFGTELKRTKDIFYNITPKSLVVLDELAEGTTIEEKLKQSYVILNGFHTIGNNTILVTHNHELVELFKDKERGQYLQVQFDGKKPTHKLAYGISKESHAERIAEKIGFAEKDIETYLSKRGYKN